MAVVRRHWAWVTAIPILILVAILALTQHGADSRRAQAQVSQQPTAPAVQPAIPQPTAQSQAAVAAYRQVQTLRGELSLQSQDLAALGVSAATAGQILNTIKTAAALGDPLANLKQAERVAKQNLSVAMRKVSMGPRDESVIASVPTLRQSVAAIQAQRAGTLAGLVGQINGLLSNDQQALWQAARDNAGRRVPEGLQYVDGLTDNQLQQLDTVARHGGASAVLSTAAQVLNGNQLSQLQNASTNRRVSAAAVAVTEAQVLPIPAGMTAIPQITPQPVIPGAPH